VSDTVKGISTGFTRLPSLKGRFHPFTGIYSSVTYVCDNASISAFGFALICFSRFNITSLIMSTRALSDLLQLLPPEPWFWRKHPGLAFQFLIWKEFVLFWPFAFVNIFFYKTVHFWSDFHILLPFNIGVKSRYVGVLRGIFLDQTLQVLA
jgi:hypothetical protein